MKKSITLLFFTLYCFTYGYAQIETFTVQNTGAFGYTSECDYSRDGGLEGNFFFDVNTISGVIGDNWIVDNIMIDVAHQNVEDLIIAMSVPANDKHLLLTLFDGGTGNNFSNTIFAPYATTLISDGVAPFSGVYLPRSPYSFLDGSDVDGFWRLKVCDLNDNNISGVVLGASITFVRKCPPPTNLLVSNITNTTANVSWTPGGTETSWELIFQGATATPPTNETSGTPLSNPSTGLSGTPLGVNASVYVRAMCGGGSISDWARVNYTSTSLCEPTSYESIQIESTFFDGASFSWDTNVDLNWNIGLRNRTFGEPPFTNSYTVFDTYSVSSTAYSINGLQQANDYELWLQPNCASGTNNHWQGPFLFTTGTLVVCVGASDLGASNITQTEATLTWTPGGSTPIDAWNLEIIDLTAGEILTGTPTVSTLTSPTYIATGLIPDHEYQFDVQAVCGSNSSGSHTFSTLAIGDCLDFTVYGTAGTWSNGEPDATKRAIFIRNYDTSLGNITACKLVVSNGATLTINAGEFALVDNDITVETGSTIEVAHQGSIVQVLDDATVTNGGTINVNVTTPVLKPRDFMMIGSPMTGVTREGELAGANRVMSHDTSLFVPNPDVAADFPMAENFADDNFNDYTGHTGVLNGGEGYLLRPRAVSATGNESASYTFTGGTLNNGVVNYGVTFQTDQNSSYNLLANPYPSAINVDDFINANAMINEIYYWEHVQVPSSTFPGANNVNFSMEDVSMYNLLGGVAAASDPSTTPTQYMATAQGFGIKASAGGMAVFNNAMRVVDNNNTLRSADATMDRIWLTVTNSTYNVTSSALVGFTDNATAGVDNGYDSDRIATAISLYSHLEDGSMELGIQGREAFNVNKVIPIGFTSTIAENTAYTISIGDIQGAGIENALVYLVDTFTNTIHSLSDSAYMFTTGAGVENNRFVLQFEDRNILSTNDIALSSISLYPNPTEGKLHIIAPQTTINTLTVMDINGHIVSTQRNVAASTFVLDMTTMSSAIYFVKVETLHGVSTKRVIKK